MLSGKPTKNLTGVLLEGEYDDLYEVVESIHRMTGLEPDNYNDPFWSVKNRLLGLCYDIRHAYQGDRSVKLVDNGSDEELMKWHSTIMPRQNLHYSVELLFPEAIFVALSVSEIYLRSSAYYGARARKRKEKEDDDFLIVHDYSDYVRDKAVLDLLSGVVLSALAEVIGDEEFEKVMKLKDRLYFNEYEYYAAMYVDKCNLEYLKTKPEKRKDKLKSIARRLAKKQTAYYNLERSLYESAREYRCSINELHDSRMEYPDEIEW